MIWAYRFNWRLLCQTLPGLFYNSIPLCILSLGSICLLSPGFLEAEELRQLPRISGPSLEGSQRLYREFFRPEQDLAFPDKAKKAPIQNKLTPHALEENDLFAKEKKLPDLDQPSLPVKKEKLLRDLFPVVGKPVKRIPNKRKPPVIQKNNNGGHNSGAKLKQDFQTLAASVDQTPAEKIETDGSAIQAPHYYQGLYLNNAAIRHPHRYQTLLTQAHSRGMNVLVVDVQPRLPDQKFIKKARTKGFYLVARVVVFEGGLRHYPPAPAHLQKIYNLVERSAQSGFSEVQLDYIRFADLKKIKGLSLSERYSFIRNILKEVERRLQSYPLRWGVDLFGRVAFNRDDRIGQKLELFAPYVDTIYPMLYPSHFYGMPQKIKDPYGTVLQGIKNSMRRVKDQAQVIAFIQAFKISIAPSRLSFVDYIYKQILAAADAGGAGYIAWNARNRYGIFFQALDKYKQNKVSGIHLPRVPSGLKKPLHEFFQLRDSGLRGSAN